VQIPLTRADWIAATVIAALRRSLNDAIRASHRDRGRQKNLLADLDGAIGELVALKRIEQAYPGCRVTYTAVSWDGPVNDVDAAVD